MRERNHVLTCIGEGLESGALGQRELFQLSVKAKRIQQNREHVRGSYASNHTLHASPEALTSETISTAHILENHNQLVIFEIQHSTAHTYLR